MVKTRPNWSPRPEKSSSSASPRWRLSPERRCMSMAMGNRRRNAGEENHPALEDMQEALGWSMP